ncbi:MAG: hypothetical protein NEA02_06380 [Thermoanaerobaculia bacterium]|nr:hypothetical protein [Thermoanaerobaculia bacterium]
MYCRKVAVHALAVPALLGLVATAQPQSPDVADAPANPPVTARIAPQAEPGDPIEIVGTLVAPDGKAPVGGAVVYAYHTDATGEYRGSSDRPKLRGWARTDDSGRFTFLTIKPAPYPAREGLHMSMFMSGVPAIPGSGSSFCSKATHGSR